MRRLLNEWESRKLLKKYKIPVPEAKLARSPAEAVKFAEDIGFPVVMKVISKDIIHKSDANCVFLNITDKDCVSLFYEKIIENAKKYNSDAEIDGILIEKQVFGVEFFVGGKIDEIFGKAMLFGIGGVFAELIKDVSARVVPLSIEDCICMLEDIKHKKIMDGFRHYPPVDKKSLANTLHKIARMFEKENIIEMDINPLICLRDQCIAADSRILMEYEE